MSVLIEAEKIRSATSLSELIGMMEERLASNKIDWQESIGEASDQEWLHRRDGMSAEINE
jgi:hypothetical protein